MIDSLHICPWWLGRILDNPIRRLIHNPEEILGGCIERGQTVLDLGCGPRTFTLAMAKMERSLLWMSRMKFTRWWEKSSTGRSRIPDHHSGKRT